MQKNGKRENQHTVPKCILKAFGHQKGREWYIHAYCKDEQRSYYPNIRGAASVGRGADLSPEIFPPGPSRPVEPEILFGEVENAAAPILKRIIELESLSWLDDDGWAKIRRLFCAQYIRSPQFAARRYGEVFENILPPMSVEHATYLNERQKGVVAEVIEKLAEGMAKKPTCLLKAPDDRHFMISDNPIVSYQHSAAPIPTNLGIYYKVTTQSHQLYLPISPELCVCCYGMWGEEVECLKAIGITRDEVMHLNVLQLRSSERQIFSVDGKFERVVEAGKRADDIDRIQAAPIFQIKY